MNLSPSVCDLVTNWGNVETAIFCGILEFLHGSDKLHIVLVQPYCKLVSKIFERPLLELSENDNL